MEVVVAKVPLRIGSDFHNVRVTNIVKESTSAFDAQDIRSVRIIDGESQLTLPVQLDFTAHRAVASDLDANGSDELVLFDRDNKVAVVSLDNQVLTFRHALDLLHSWGMPEIGPFCSESQQLLIVYGAFPSGGRGSIAAPVAYVWDQTHGFQKLPTIGSCLRMKFSELVNAQHNQLSDLQNRHFELLLSKWREGRQAF